jgi:hypothetical protein
MAQRVLHVKQAASRLLARRFWFGVGDVVRTPSGREAEVAGNHDGRLHLRYLDHADRHGVQVQPHLVTLVRKAGT